MSKKRLEYREPDRLTIEQARMIVQSSPAEASHALVSVAFHEPSLPTALSLIVPCAHSKDPMIRGAAILCFGHLARLHGSLPKDAVMRLIKAGLVDESPYVRGQAESAAYDVEVYLPSWGPMFG